MSPRRSDSPLPSDDPPGALRPIVIVEDEDLLRWGLVSRFEKAGLAAMGCRSAEEALEVADARECNMVLLDLRLPGMDGMECLQRLRQRHPHLPVVMMTGHGAIETAVEAMRLGATNYLTKPFDFKTVLAMAQSLRGGAAPAAPARAAGAGRRQVVPRPTSLRAGIEVFGIESLVGSSPALQQLRALTAKIARRRPSVVLLTGESGVGKDHLAKVIHYNSEVASSPFLHVNVAALLDPLFESELFGHEQGAFTDAKATKKGLLEMAADGTVYLDEIGELSPALQVSLLHVLENRSFKRVGGLREIPLRARIIAATNANLSERVAEGRFRRDLYYRLRVIPIHIPPLRERGDDVLFLAEHFLERFNAHFGRRFEGFTAEARTRLREHLWPGNIRELRNAIERACILEEGDVIDAAMLAFDVLDPSVTRSPDSFPSEQGLTLEELERKMILSTLAKTDWNQSRAAKLLGLGRDALRYRMKKFNLL